jgi:ATP/maltotriose-dependent transcriptional regulator MalT
MESAMCQDRTHTARQSLPEALTGRELEVLRLIADGLSNYEIAVRLFVGVSTVKTHVNRIFSKLCTKNRTQAVARRRELRLL